MKKVGFRIFGIALFFVVAIIAVAGSWTFTTTAADDKIIHKMLTIKNAQRTSQGQGAITTQQFVQGLSKKLITGSYWRRQRRRLLRKKTQSQLDNFVNP